MYSNSNSSPINYPGSPAQQMNYPQVGFTQLKALNDQSYRPFFRQAELITGQIFGEADKEIFIDHAKIKRLRKRQYFLQETDVCRYIGFITKGATKTYSINERGQETILCFRMENDWVTDMESFLDHKESGYHIEALEDLEMIIMDRKQLYALMALIPAMHELVQRFQFRQLIESQQRITAALSMTAEERYANMLLTKPNYIHRFSQNMLACYLGVKPETLSRIRKH